MPPAVNQGWAVSRVDDREPCSSACIEKLCLILQFCSFRLRRDYGFQARRELETAIRLSDKSPFSDLEEAKKALATL